MSHCDFQAQVRSPLKAVGRHQYAHLDAFHLLPADATARLAAAESLAQIARGDRYNVARFDNSHNRVALLNYPNFFEDAFPALHESWHVDLTLGRVSYRSYRDSLTPPILHRKELMLPEDPVACANRSSRLIPSKASLMSRTEKPARRHLVRQLLCQRLWVIDSPPRAGGD